jgi:hypothetical protein
VNTRPAATAPRETLAAGYRRGRNRAGETADADGRVEEPDTRLGQVEQLERDDDEQYAERAATDPVHAEDAERDERKELAAHRARPRDLHPREVAVAEDDRAALSESASALIPLPTKPRMTREGAPGQVSAKHNGLAAVSRLDT